MLSTLDVQASPPGAEVTINGRRAARCRCSARCGVAGGSIPCARARSRLHRLRADARPAGARQARDRDQHGGGAVVAAAPPPILAPVVVAPGRRPVSSRPRSCRRRRRPERAAELVAGRHRGLADEREDPQGDPERHDPATGFEMALNFGYHAVDRRPEDREHQRRCSARRSLLGARPILWPLSFGVQIKGGFDPGT